jgi:hypothetical protein
MSVSGSRERGRKYARGGRTCRRREGTLMFETNYDGFNQFWDEAVGGRRKEIYEFIRASPNFMAAPNALQTSRPG